MQLTIKKDSEIYKLIIKIIIEFSTIKNFTNISSLTKGIDYLNNKIKIKDEKLLKIESSLEAVINILKKKPELDKRSKSNNTNHSTISLGSKEKNDKKITNEKNI